MCVCVRVCACVCDVETFLEMYILIWEIPQCNIDAGVVARYQGAVQRVWYMKTFPCSVLLYIGKGNGCWALH